ncbi:MAG TPA: leucine--tRNA ligase, partial [Bacteroidales bacterium]|nr:leucine--tRNA ligase [Bacteroidales bacterium]
MEYSFHEIEKKWQQYWEEQEIYQVGVESDKPKYYVLDMFPYPSGAGLHVGHPLGYIASDIFARYKRMEGYNVLHPMGYDAFGLPAEQYAIQTGQHPAKTTDQNIKRYREQLQNFGFSYDWSRELRTCDPNYYKWTQWAFIEMFEHWYDNKQDRARPVEDLKDIFSREGNRNVDAAANEVESFGAEAWKNMSEKEQQEILLNYRIAYLADSLVNWCPELGTVLANDEVKEGLSVRGGHPVIQKEMKQWSLRVTAYADRLLDGLESLEWSESLKEIQRNWIGRSQGAEILFDVEGSDEKIEVFTTRPDTLFGVSFMVLAPESDLAGQLTTADYREKVEAYVQKATSRSERDRIADTQSVTGQFIGNYALHPFTGDRLPIYVSDYVLIGYGTGAIMAVPAHDERDHSFAKHFNLPIVPVIEGGDPDEEAYDSLEGKVINSQFINGYRAEEAIPVINKEIEKRGLGREKVNYRLRDAIFSRQRYWGEPFPIYYKDGIPYPLDKSQLPLELPEVDAFKPTPDGRPPLARAKNWQTEQGYPLEYSTMPGFAGSSAYYLRFMDPHNEKALVSNEANQYWRNVDLYVGGIEHATGHLIYSRFWNKFLYDIGWVWEDEPFKKLINQGMIQGRSNFVYRLKGTNKFVSYNLKEDYDVTPLHVDVNIVDNDVLDIEAFRQWNPEYKDAEFILEDGKYICGYGIEKMSKSLYNVINPDDIIEKYGADTLRMYEMFLGPIDMSKPWDTNGIDGVYKFLRKFWRLFHDDQGQFILSDEVPQNTELKTLHKTIKKVRDDVEQFSFNTAISAMMIAVNEFSSAGCNKRQVLMPLLRLLAPFAPHIAEELWHRDGNETTVVDVPLPEYEEQHMKETIVTYPVSF